MCLAIPMEVVKIEEYSALVSVGDIQKEVRLDLIDEMPEVIVSIIESSEAPGGIGEPGVPPLAAAMENAIFKGTGTRYRAIPQYFSRP